MPEVIHGDCLDVLATLEACSIDAVVCDPPYGLKFMDKAWDHGVPGPQFWEAALRVCKPGAHLVAFGGTRTHHRLMVAIEDAGWEIRDCLMWLYGTGFPKSKATLKPAWEPIILARKKPTATSTLNIDACRIGDEAMGWGGHGSAGYAGGLGSTEVGGRPVTGRWPANVVLDDVAADMLGERARFFYCPKASRTERADNTHPTVKPLALMQWVVRLVTPSGGLVLDPFCGSGSTGVACAAEGFAFVGIEREAEYVEIARARLAHAQLKAAA